MVLGFMKCLLFDKTQDIPAVYGGLLSFMARLASVGVSISLAALLQNPDPDFFSRTHSLTRDCLPSLSPLPHWLGWRSCAGWRKEEGTTRKCWVWGIPFSLETTVRAAAVLGL